MDLHATLQEARQAVRAARFAARRAASTPSALEAFKAAAEAEKEFEKVYRLLHRGKTREGSTLLREADQARSEAHNATAFWNECEPELEG